MTKNNKSLEQAYIDMILRNDFNSFITVTLKQGLAVDQHPGMIRAIADEDCRRTAWCLRDRLNKRLIPKQAKQGQSLPFAVFKEGNDLIRRHLHIMAVCPSDWSWDNYVGAVRRSAATLEWVWRHIDIKPIKPGTERKLAGYCLKSGANAFIAEASSI